MIARNAASTAPDVSGSNSTVAEFKVQDSTTEPPSQTSDTTTTHGAKAFPALSESALTELKAAYDQVESALSEAAKATPGDQTAAATDDGAAKDIASQGTGAKTDARLDARKDDASGKETHPASLNPLVKVLADATGETTAEAKDVLQQVHAGLRQEHVQQAGQSGDQSSAHGSHDGASAPANRPAANQPADNQATLWYDRQDRQGGADSAA